MNNRKTMNYKSSEIKAGLFILISVLVFIAFLATIIGNQYWSDSVIYRCQFRFAGGIEEGSVVRFAGLHVGQVKEIRLPTPERATIELVLELKEDIPVRSNSEARLTTIGLMGSYYVEISSGTNDASLLPPGSLIPGKDVRGFSQLLDPVGQATDELHTLLGNLNQLFNAENRANLSAMLQSMSKMTSQNAEKIDDLIDHTTELSIQVSETVEVMNHFIRDNNVLVKHNFQQLDSLLQETRKAMHSAGNVMELSQGTIVENRESMHTAMENLLRTSQNLSEFSRNIKEHPWRLIRKDYPEERDLAE